MQNQAYTALLLPIIGVVFVVPSVSGPVSPMHADIDSKPGTHPIHFALFIIAPFSHTGPSRSDGAPYRRRSA